MIGIDELHCLFADLTSNAQAIKLFLQQKYINSYFIDEVLCIFYIYSFICNLMILQFSFYVKLPLIM